MTYSELSAAARGGIGPFCRACPVCDGRACAGVIPGPGDKGVGRVAHRNWQAWQGLRVSMDTLHDTWAADTGTTVLGQRLSLPVMVGPVGDVQRHYGERYDTVSYNRCALEAAAGEGTLAWTGDGLDASIMTEACGLIAELGGRGVPTVKPWDEVTLGEKLDEALAARPAAVAMDIDAAGPSLPARPGAARRRQVGRPGGRGRGALPRGGGALRAEGRHDAVGGRAGRRGGRRRDRGLQPRRARAGRHAGHRGGPAGDRGRRGGSASRCSWTAGVRSGLDVFRALALGARACLVCRPFVVATFGGGAEGVRAYLGELRSGLADAMEMCGAATVADVTRDMLWG